MTPRGLRIVQRLIVVAALFGAVVGSWSLYGAWSQVRGLELNVLSPNLRPGIPAVVNVVTSGRTYVNVHLELVQGAHTAMLATLGVAQSHGAIYNSRPRHGTMTPTFTADFLGQFQPGPAVLRATATGQRAWLHEPSPVVQEVAVVVMQP